MSGKMKALTEYPSDIYVCLMPHKELFACIDPTEHISRGDQRPFGKYIFKGAVQVINETRIELVKPAKKAAKKKGKD